VKLYGTDNCEDFDLEISGGWDVVKPNLFELLFL
jgi:hypothetical protein